jgi:hypothetical protein
MITYICPHATIKIDLNGARLECEPKIIAQDLKMNMWNQLEREKRIYNFYKPQCPCDVKRDELGGAICWIESRG